MRFRHRFPTPSVFSRSAAFRHFWFVGAAIFYEDILFGNTIIGVSIEALRRRGYPVRTLYLKLLPVDGEMYTPAAQSHEHDVGDYMVASKHPLYTQLPCWRSVKNLCDKTLESDSWQDSPDPS